MLCLLLPFLFAVSLAAAGASPADMVRIPAGIYRPLFRGAGEPTAVPVKAFYLDVLPVSNADYLAFVRANPRWRRSAVKRIFADENYLKNWGGDLVLGGARADAPVTFVPWFAARAYAQWKGKRLPTVAEWEYAASASATRRDGDKDPRFKAEVLRWYCDSGATELLSVTNGAKNFYGVRGLHGLVWEWVADFSSAVLSDDSRDGGPDARFFCGGGAQDAQTVDDYPAFMRYAFRSSLKADYCIHNLGFRCAKDL